MTVPLSQLLETSIGGVWGKPLGELDVDVDVLRVTELRPGGKLDPSTAAHRSVSRRQLESRQLQNGDLLLEKSGGGPTTPVGRVGLVDRLLGPSVCSNFMQLMRLRTDLVEPRFLHLYLNHLHSVGGTVPLQTASTNIRNISSIDYFAVAVPMPKLSEQRRIVDILEDHLSRLDAATASLTTARKRLIAYQRAALEKLTEGAATQHIALGDALRVIEAGRSFGGAARPSHDDEWGIVKVSAMTWGEFRPAENKLVSDQSKADLRYQIHAGDLLMSRANTSEYVGAPVLVRAEPSRLLLSDKSLRLVPREGVAAEYLWRVLSAPRARAQVSNRASGNQDSMRNISQVTLKTIRIPWTDRQSHVIAAANDLDDQHGRLSIAIDRSRARGEVLRRALLRAAFRGQLTGRSSDLDRAEEAAG